MEYISIGKLLNFHGIKGEAKVGFTKGKENQIKALQQVIIDDVILNVETVRFHKQFALIKFKEINSIDELLRFKGLNIYIPKSKAKECLENDEYLITDLIGLNVFDQNDDFIGVIEDVGDNGAENILSVKSEVGEILIPFIKEIVPIVDISKKKIVLKTIEGLIEDEG